MIAFYRTANVAPGKGREAMAFAKEVSTYITQTTGVEVSVAVPIGGNPNRIGWSTRHDNLAAFEGMNNKLAADPKYAELAASAGAYFLAGSLHDEIWSGV